MNSPLLQARNIKRGFGRGQGRVEVLRGVNLTADGGEMIAIVGASGSGKTTLLQILGTIDAPESGELFFAGTPLLGQGEQDLARHRNRNIGFIFQFHHLLPEFTALENVMMPGRIGGQPEDELAGRAMNLLERVGLGHRFAHRPGELSGGEQQRVALARALVMRPALLLADEPTGNLDSKSGQAVFALLAELCRSMGMCVVMVTHNLELADLMDKKFSLRDGHLC